MGARHRLRTTYKVITATGGVTGEFDTVVEDFAFLDAELDYNDSYAVNLTMFRNDASFCSVSKTANQCSTANAAENAGPGHPIHDSIIDLSEKNARTAFDQLSGELHPSLQGVMIEDSRFTRSAANDRIANAFADNGSQEYALAPNDSKATDITHEIWAQVFGSQGTRSSNADHHAIDRNALGFVVGADTTGHSNAQTSAEALNTWRLGFLAAYRQSDTTIASLNSTADTESYSVGAYGGAQFGRVGVSLGGDYSWHDISTRRTLTYTGTLTPLLANYEAQTAQFYGEVSYRISDKITASEPVLDLFASAAHIRHDTDGFSETGGSAALTAQSSQTNTTFSTLGVRGKFVIYDNISVKGALAWRYNLQGTSPSTDFTFAGSNSFAITGMSPENDVAVIEVGLDWRMSDRASAEISYIGHFGDYTSDHGARGTIGFGF